MALRNGGEWPSVTEVFELNGLVDLSMIPSSILEAKKKLGGEVHAWTEMIDHGKVRGSDAPEHLIGYIRAYKNFCAFVNFEPLEIELPVVNETHLYDGTLDRTGLIHARPSLLDIKCVYALHHTTALQTAGYAACLEGPHDRYALQLKPDESFKLEPYKSRQDRHDFLAFVRAAHYKLRHKEELPWLAL